MTAAHDNYCVPGDDAGDPRREGRCGWMVALTFEHPLIMPLISSIWPHLTLHSDRSGLLEQFRVARVLGVPIMACRTVTDTSTPVTPSLDAHRDARRRRSPTRRRLPTRRPNTATPTSTETPTATETPTPTETLPDRNPDADQYLDADADENANLRRIP